MIYWFFKYGPIFTPWLVWLIVKLDLLWHPWLRNTGFQWWYFVTTPHSPTLIYLHHPVAFWQIVWVFSVLWWIVIILKIIKKASEDN